MTNVRMDANGIPQGPVYEPTAPLPHRSGVTAVDATDPADVSVAIDPQGYAECRLDLAVAGTGFTSLDVQVLFWNERLSAWFGGAKRRLDSTGNYSLTVACRGQKLFLKVAAFVGTSFTLDADYSLS